MGTSNRAKQFINRVDDGTLQKRYLPNHGFDYTNGPEDIARMRFNNYIGSCGYRLMKHRIEAEARTYRG